MKFRLLTFSLITGLLSFQAKAQDTHLSTVANVKIESLPISLEQEEEALILERHQAKFQKDQKELQRELSQLEFGKQEAEEKLFYLQNQRQQSEGGHNAHSQELHMLYKERTSMLGKVAELLMESELQESSSSPQDEDWELAPISYAQEIQRLNASIRKLDTRIAVYEMAIPQQINELEELQEQIDETIDLSDQLQILQESNQQLIKKLEE